MRLRLSTSTRDNFKELEKLFKQKYGFTPSKKINCYLSN